jgi:hypothetical protein
LSAAELLLGAAGLYLALGALFAVPFLLVGVQRVDPAAGGAWAFRLLVRPGCVALWPLLARRWRAALARDAGTPA